MPEKPVVVLISNMARTLYKHRLPLILALRQSGYRVILAAPFDESVGALMEASGAAFVNLQHFRRNSMHPIQEARAIFEIRKLFRTHQPETVLSFGIQSVVLSNLAACWNKKIGNISVITGLGYSFLHTGWIRRAVRLLLRLSLRRSAAVVFENQDDQAWMLEKKMVRSAQSVWIPGSGIDLAYFKPGSNAGHHNQVVFTFIGRLLYDKGLREFAEAATELKKVNPHVACWIVGPLDEANPAHVQQKELIKWVRSGAVQYKGVVEDVRPLIEQSDWIVLPSYREGLSRVLLEAMAMQKPLITTDTPGCRETVEPGINGFCVPIQNTQALFDTMSSCCKIPKETVRQMGAYSRIKAEKEFNSSYVNGLFLSLLDNLSNRI